jgi:hypothetical protein
MDKETREAEQREAHKKRRREQKRRRREGRTLKRSEPYKIEKPTILIVCEGENTEISYFRQFKLTTANIVLTEVGAGAAAVLEKAKQVYKPEEHEIVACVFDKDEVPDEVFNATVKEAQRQGFMCAWSNQAFEYWFLLHVIDHQAESMHRREYHQKLNEHLKGTGISYEGKRSKMVTDTLFEYFEAIDSQSGKPRVQLAIERSERNEKRHQHKQPAQAESCTLVHHLVKKIRQFR